MTATRLSAPIFAIFAVLAFIVAACSGGGSGDDRPGGVSSAGKDISDEEFVSAGVDVLTKSIQSYSAEEITSMSGDMVMDFSMDEGSFSGTVTFAVEDDAMHMKMSIEGGEEESFIDLSELGQFEMLYRDGSLYMNIPFFGGWFVMDPEDMGEDADMLDDLLSQGSPFDYTELADAFGGDVEYVGDEDINGHNTAHYRVTSDFASLVDAISGALETAGDEDLTAGLGDIDFGGPLTFDVWVGKDDLLPYQMEFDASFDSAETGGMEMHMVMHFNDYNQPVDIPDAPEGAQSLDEFFSEAGWEAVEDGD